MLLTVRLVTAALAVTIAATALKAAQVPGTFADLAGRRLWYLDTGGDGVPVMFLHARSGSSAFWERQIEAFRGSGYRFVAYDRIGSGRSVLEPGSDPGSGADDLQSLLIHLRIDRFHLVGTGAGGIVALDYALSFPERLRSLTVANSIGGVQDDDYLTLGRRMRPSPEFEALPTEFRELGPSYRAAQPEGTARWVELERQGHPTSGLPDAQRTRHRLTFGLLETIRVPTLLLTGDADLYTPPAVLRLFESRIGNAESLVVSEAGHSSYWERPEVFNEAVLSFVAKH